MSSCCKTNVKSDENNISEIDKLNFKTIKKYFKKILLFLVVMLFTPFMYFFMCLFIFKTIVLSRDIDFRQIVAYFTKKYILKENDEDDVEEDDNEYYDLTDEDVIMTSVDDISNKDTTK